MTWKKVPGPAPAQTNAQKSNPKPEIKKEAPKPENKKVSPKVENQKAKENVKEKKKYDPLEHTRYGEGNTPSTNDMPIPNPLKTPLTITNSKDEHDFKIPNAGPAKVNQKKPAPQAAKPQEKDKKPTTQAAKP